MASTFPPVPTPSQFFFQQGDQPTTLVWGTDGMLDSYIVVSATFSQRVEEIDIENGTGFEATVILLEKGLDASFEVIDDTSITPPLIGAIATISGPYGGSLPMLVVQSAASEARKREGMRTLSMKTYNAINGLN